MAKEPLGSGGGAGPAAPVRGRDARGRNRTCAVVRTMCRKAPGDTKIEAHWQRNPSSISDTTIVHVQIIKIFANPILSADEHKWVRAIRHRPLRSSASP